MDFDTNWNIEKYKSPFESEEHWELRKSFLVAHKTKYPEDQLVCLAQVFFNIELLGCRYPEETMKLVSELSEGIADSYREKKQEKLQRTFVKASDAAGARLKGTVPLPTPPATTTARVEQKVLELNQSKPEEEPALNPNEKVISVSVCEQFYSCVDKYFRDIIIMKNVQENFFDHGASILQRLLSKSRVSPTYTYECAGPSLEPTWKCILSIGELNMAYATAKNKIVSKKAAIELVLCKLQSTCYTIEEKKKFVNDGSAIQRDISCDQANKRSSEDDAFVDNVGSKMMKMMGWKGGGLGKSEQGISSPVTVQNRVSRLGFGMNLSESELMKKIEINLKTYARTNTNHDLVFSNDFSKEERAKLHQIALRLHLKSRSYGKGTDRHLVISKASNQESIIETLMNCGGENEKYRLIPPAEM